MSSCERPHRDFLENLLLFHAFSRVQVTHYAWKFCTHHCVNYFEADSPSEGFQTTGTNSVASLLLRIGEIELTLQNVNLYSARSFPN